MSLVKVWGKFIRVSLVGKYLRIKEVMKFGGSDVGFDGSFDI